MLKQHFFKSKKSFSKCRLASQDFSLTANQIIFSSTEKKKFLRMEGTFLFMDASIIIRVCTLMEVQTHKLYRTII